MTIGNRLKDVQPRQERSRHLLYELVLLNFNLPARVWLPLYAHSSTHLVVRIPYTGLGLLVKQNLSAKMR